MNKKHNRFRASMSAEQYDELQSTEIKSKRTRFGKVFALGANRFQAVTYTDPVHRYNEKTHEWDEMDNRFAATPRMKEAKAAWKQGIMPAVARGDVLLECKTGSLDVACAMSGETPFINLTDAEGRHLAWGIKDAMSILPEADEISDTPAKNVRGMREKVLDHLHGEVTYHGIFAGVDLRCKLDRGFKDELIFAEKESVRPIAFLLESEGRQMELNEHNILTVKDEQGEAVFRLQAPFMLDANEQRGEVAVQLEAWENGMYTMTYIPDPTFIENACFPVVLDPAIESVRGETGITDTYVMEGSSTNFHDADQIWICNNTSFGKRYGYMRVVNLPPIDANHFITGAFLHLRNYSAPTADTPLMCSEVLEDWDIDTLSFAAQPEVNPLYQDYCIFPANRYFWQQLDVTTLARKWYLGNNKGVILTPHYDNYNAVRIQSSECTSKPYFTVNYASLAGLEDYLTYDSQPAGIAGSGYVSLANGNMIFAHSDTAMNGNRMPVSVTHYYNSCDANVDEFGLGYGWRTSMHQTLHKEYINEEVMYVYTDGDGTEHWFEVDEDDNTQYVDMSGLSLTLTVGNDGTITITSKGDSCMVFPAIAATPTADVPATGKVLIAKIQDAVDNQIMVTARFDNPLYVHEILDGVGRKTTFEYTIQEDGSLKCTAIKTPWQTDGACTRFAYVDSCLTTITHEDNRDSIYHYETRNGYKLLDQAQGADGIAVRYEYSNTDAIYGLPHCITYAESGDTAILSTNESVRNGALYATKTTYNYGNHLTLVTDNISGKALRYHFNDNGNQTSIDDGLGYAIYTEYDQSGDNANAPINHATTRSRMQRVVKNWLLDSMIEEGSSVWETSSVGTFTRDQTTDQWGLVSYKVNVPTGYTTYVRQAVTLKPGGQYTLSAYMKSAAPKAFVRAAYTYHGETRYFSSDAVPVDANASTGEFKRVAVSFTLPDEADAIVYCEAVGMTNNGHFWFDCMQLEEGLTCNHYNMLQNSDFTYTKAGSTLPASWEIDTASRNFISVRDLSAEDDIDGKMAPQFLQGSRAVRLAGRYDRTVTLTQDFRCYGNVGDRFTAGGWCKSFAKKVDTSTSVYCCLNVYFSRGSYWQYGGSVTFNYGEDDWQFASSSIVAPDNYTKIRFALYMNRQMNHADFTGLYLYPESFGTDYVYDAKGNRKEAIQLYGGVKKTEFDDHDNMIRYTAPGHTKSSTFSYGDMEDEQKKHLLLESSSPLGTKGSYGYDTNGNAVRSDTFCGSGTSGLITRSTTEYQHNGNYVHKQTDARGKTVTTAIDPDKGVTTEVTDPKGQTVIYEYDSLRRVEKVKTTDGAREFRNEYTYDQTRGLLTGVKHNVDDNENNDVVYSFEYDALGRKTKVKVGNTTLSTNVYQNDPEQAHYGTLSQMQYGNGTVVKNEYDDFNRVTGVKYDSEANPRYQYDYNANGQVAYVRNNLINQIAESEYDLSNRPCRIKTHKFIADAAGNVTSQEHVYTGEVAYNDTFGRLTKFTERVGINHETFVTEFGYDEENRPRSLDYGTHGESTLTYDGLGRVAEATVKAGSGTANTTTYTYVEGAALPDVTGKTSTSGLVASITQTGGNFTYTYDDNGNITSVVQDGVTTAYTYDALGQLIRVVDGQEGATWEYTYDQGGNILSKKKFVGADETESMVFGYVHEGSELDETQIAENGWRDLLKYVNGKRIYYDEIGNPKQFGEDNDTDKVTYTWQNGRQLARMQSVDVDASFVYNENGLRVQKTVNGVVTDYTLHGKNIVHMSQGSNTLHFFYDAQNKPAVVVYNGVPYTYVKNLQGDIVAILDSTGTVVVNYIYDAWGKPISKTGSMKDSLGKLNPFRYRGYVYDEETGLYYVSSRFYNWTAGRWINSDDIAYLGADGTVLSNMLYAYCANSPVNKIDFDGNLGLAIGLFIGASALIGGLAGALTAACTGGNVLEGALEGAALGAVAATATIVAPIIVTAVVPATLSTATVTMIATGATFVASGLGGMGVDYITQRISHAFSENSNEAFQLDKGRMLKTGVANGIAGVIPTFGAPNESVVNAVGSLAMGFDASFINAVIEIVTVRSLE